MTNVFNKYLNFSMLNFIVFCKYNDVFFFSTLFGRTRTHKKTLSSIFKKLANFVYIFVVWFKARALYYANNWVYTTNHKRIAVNYFWFVILSGIFGMVLATVIRLELAYPGVGIFAGDSLQYLSLATAHGVIMVFFMIIPLISGAFANFLLPTQLGVHDVAFPRLNSAAFWFLPGGLVMLGQLICLDRRYQRMNCFNIREAQSLLKKRFFADLVTSNDHRLLLDQTMLGLRFKTNDLTSINSNLQLQNYLGLNVTPKIRRSFFKIITEDNNFSFINENTNLFERALEQPVFLKKPYFSSFILDLIQGFQSTHFQILFSFKRLYNFVFYVTTDFSHFYNYTSLCLQYYFYKTLESFFYITSFRWVIDFARIFISIISAICKSVWINLIYPNILNDKKRWNETMAFGHERLWKKLVFFDKEYLGSSLDYLFRQLFDVKVLINFLSIFDFLASATTILFSFLNKFVFYYEQLNSFFLSFLSLKYLTSFYDSNFFYNRLLKIYSTDSKFYVESLSFKQNKSKVTFFNLASYTSFIDYWSSTSSVLAVSYNLTKSFIVTSSTWNALHQIWVTVASVWFLPALFNVDNLKMEQIFTRFNCFVDFKTFIMAKSISFVHFFKLFYNDHILSYYNMFKTGSLLPFIQSYIQAKIVQIDQKSVVFGNFFLAAIVQLPIFIWDLIVFLDMLLRFVYPEPNLYRPNVEALVAFAKWFYKGIKIKLKLSSHEPVRRYRGLRFNTPIFAYDYKTGNYFPKFYQENMTYLVPTFADMTGGLRTTVWFLSLNAHDAFKANKQNFFEAAFERNRKTRFFQYSRPLARLSLTEPFYNLFKDLSERVKFENFYWLPSSVLIQKFENMFLGCSMQQRIYSNWRQLKFTREAWRCKLLVARHQKSLFRRYVHENGLFWSIERNARDLLPGWAMITPFSSRSRFTAIGKVDIGVSAILLVLVSSIISAVNFLVTYRYLSTLNNRKMRDARSFFTEGIMCSSWMMIAANPMLIIGLIMLLCDRHWQTSFFDYSGGGDTILFQHMFWFFGHPEVYIVIIPTFGFVNTLFSYYLRKRISARASLIYSIYTIAFLGFFVWGHHMYMVGLSHTTRMLFSTLTVMISVPAATKLMHWCVTLVNSSFVVELPFLFMLIYVFLFVSGGISGMCVAHTGMDILFHDTFYVIGHFHVMFAGAAMFACFGAFYFYFSAIFGVKYSRVYAYMHFTYYLLGQLLTVVPMFWLGYAGMPRRVLDYPSAFGGWHSIITAGHLLSVAGLISFFVMIFDSMRQGKAASRTTLGIIRYNTRLNFYLYEISRIVVNQQRGSYLYRYFRPDALKLNGYQYNNYEYLETTLFSYTFNKSK